MDLSRENANSSLPLKNISLYKRLIDSYLFRINFSKIEIPKNFTYNFLVYNIVLYSKHEWFTHFIEMLATLERYLQRPNKAYLLLDQTLISKPIQARLSICLSVCARPARTQKKRKEKFFLHMLC